LLALGLSGGLDLMYQRRDYLFPPGTCHDSAAALAEDGRIIAAIEEERLNRIKHTSKGAVNAIRYCLQTRGIALRDLDALLYYGSEPACDIWMRNLFYGSRDAAPVVTYRQLIHAMLREGVGEDIDDSKLVFVDHHLAHAISAYAQSGFAESLVVTLDGAGDGLCGSVTHWKGADYRVLALYPQSKSLGMLYDRVIQMLGYGFTEEYKVMGLAPYGDPARFRGDFARLYTLLPRGEYVIHWEQIESLFALARVRKRDEPILREHMEIAAALQDALERVVYHVLHYFREATGLQTLCLAGGVAHNSTLNGRVLYSAMFRDIFVHPASHDSGCAIGAALFPFVSGLMGVPRATPAQLGRIEHVFWGSDIGTSDSIGAVLAQWRPLLEFARVPNIAERAAQLIADGKVLGWIQDRAEFGPRALGNRSILADPRPAGHKTLINDMVKKRESYRPFAPAVLEEHAAEYFELPPGIPRSPYMSFTVKVRPEWCEKLGATTHVDRTARIQTVSRQTQPRFWELIDAFREITSVAVLLNTSFNNNAEPIVNSIEDAMTCFLTTQLDYLVIGDYLVAKNGCDAAALLGLRLSLPAYARLVRSEGVGPGGSFQVAYSIGTSYDDRSVSISEGLYGLLSRNGALHCLRDLVAEHGNDAAAVAEELRALWESRLVRLQPLN
jgi:carbamoyltransferase